MIARVLFITVILLAMAQAAPPIKIRPSTAARCVDVKNIAYNTDTQQCSMDIKVGKNDAYTFASGSTLQALVDQTTCDFIPFFIGTTMCSELIKRMPI
jgi:uroporphyrinogen-III synthase